MWRGKKKERDVKRGASGLNSRREVFTLKLEIRKKFWEIGRREQQLSRKGEERQGGSAWKLRVDEKKVQGETRRLRGRGS